MVMQKICMGSLHQRAHVQLNAYLGHSSLIPNLWDLFQNLLLYFFVLRVYVKTFLSVDRSLHIFFKFYSQKSLTKLQISYIIATWNLLVD